MRFSCWNYCVTGSSQLQPNAAPVLDYSGRVILLGLDDLRIRQLIVQLLHSGFTIEPVVGLKFHNSAATVDEFRCSYRVVRMYDLSGNTSKSFTANQLQVEAFS